MKVLLLAHCFAHRNANTFRYRRLCEQLSREGHSVDVVGDHVLCDYSLPTGVRYFALRSDLKRWRSIAVIGWFSVIELLKLSLLWLTSLKHPYLGYSVLMNGVYRYRLGRLLRQNRYDVVLLSVVPWTLYTFARGLSKQAPLVIDISDPLFKNAFVDDCVSGTPRFARFEARALKYADRVAVMSEPLVELYHRELGVERDKLSFVSPSTDVSKYQRDAELFYEMGCPLRMVYAGTLYPAYRDLNELLDAVREVPDVCLEVVTQKAGMQMPQVSWHGWMSQQQLAEHYRQADVLVFVDNFYGYQVPSKIFELIALNKPILFIYDTRNDYLYEKLKDQAGIFPVQNKKADLVRALNEIIRQHVVRVRYTMDLVPFSVDAINQQLISLLHKAIFDHVHK